AAGAARARRSKSRRVQFDGMVGSPQWDGVLLDVIVDSRNRRADVVELLGVFDSVLAAQLAVAGEHEFLDVGSLRGGVVVAGYRKAQVARGQLLAQARAVSAARTFGPIAAI